MDETESSAGSAPEQSGAAKVDRDGDKAPSFASPPALPPALPLGAPALAALAESARDYARSAVAQNTLKAYARDWAHYRSWCRKHGAEVSPPSPETIGLYVAHCAQAGDASDGARGLSVATIERRVSGLCWNFAQRGYALDRGDPHIASVLAGVRRRHGRPPLRKEAVSTADICAMVATLGHDLRGLRDRTILLMGFAGGLRRSEIVGLDRARGDLADGECADDGAGWVEIEPAGALVVLRGKTGWREVEIGRAANAGVCPVGALERWLDVGRIRRGPVFRRISRDGARALEARLGAQHVALLVKRTAEAAGLRGDLPERARRALFSGHSLRAGFASHAEVEERHVQKQLGHASAEMTRRYQRRRDRYRVNLTRALGL